MLIAPEKSSTSRSHLLAPDFEHMVTQTIIYLSLCGVDRDSYLSSLSKVVNLMAWIASATPCELHGRAVSATMHLAASIQLVWVRLPLQPGKLFLRNECRLWHRALHASPLSSVVFSSKRKPSTESTSVSLCIDSSEVTKNGRIQGTIHNFNPSSVERISLLNFAG